MNPSRLRRRIEIQEKQMVRNPYTKLMEEQWVTIYTCWAQIEKPYGRKYFDAVVAHLEYAIFFHIRYKDGIKPGMRVHFNNTDYDIEQVNPDLQYKRMITLQCKEVE